MEDYERDYDASEEIDEETARALEEERRIRRRAAAIRRARRRKRRAELTILLVVLMFALAGGTGFYFYLKRGGSLSGFALPYATSREFAASVLSKDHLRAEPFAENLCVMEGDVPREGISLPSYPEGLLFSLSDKKVLFAQSPFLRVYPAPLTKLVTAMIALEYGNLSDVVTISEADVNLEEGSQVCGFWAGDELTMNQLLHCLLVYSGNDAAMAIAEHVGGTIDNFVVMMNNYARDLGCTGTHFVNPSGLHDENHYTTPYDIYLMLKEAASHPEFTEISQMGVYVVEYEHYEGTYVRTMLEATDHYLTGEATLPKNISVLGGKTGTTDEAGNCLALLTQNAYGQPYISIIMGAYSKEELYEQMNELLLAIRT